MKRFLCRVFIHSTAYCSLLLSFLSLNAKNDIITHLARKYNINSPHTSALSVDTYAENLIKKYHLERANIPFSYKHDTEIYTDELGLSKPLNPFIQEYAEKKYNYLNNAFFFKDLSILSKPQEVRKYQLNKRSHHKEKGVILTTLTSDGETITGTLLDRGSDTLIVVGGGFTNYREQMAPFGDLYHEHDVLFFDYRGHGAPETQGFVEWISSWLTWKGIIKRSFGVDISKIKLGLTEEKDVRAIVDEAKAYKTYKQVVGLGICYSAMIFLKTQALHPHTFNKLIIDGVWLSLDQATKVLSKDLAMLWSPQRGGWSSKPFSQNKRFRKALLSLAEYCSGIEFNTLSLLDYVPNLSPDLPILFIHGKDDLMSGREQFEHVWNATGSKKKAALITSNEHVWNHLKQKEVYKLITDLFITHSPELFSEITSSEKSFKEHLEGTLSFS